MHSDARMLIAVRVVVVTTLLMASLIIQFTVRELLPINYIYLTAGLSYALTLVKRALRRASSPRVRARSAPRRA